jgi:hypothetical protein
MHFDILEQVDIAGSCAYEGSFCNHSGSQLTGAHNID